MVTYEQIKAKFKNLFIGFAPFDEEEKAALQLEIRLKEQLEKDRFFRDQLKRYHNKVIARRKRMKEINEQSGT